MSNNVKRAAKWDSSEFLESSDDIRAYLNAAVEEDDPALLYVALNNVARAKGMSQLARETGISRDGLYKALSADGNPSFATVSRILRVLGLRFDVVGIE